MKDSSKYKVPKGRKAWFKAYKGVLKIFKHKPEIINLNEKLEDKAIYISNHSAASGPIILELYFPKAFIPWGTYQMCGNYKERWNYLYHTYCQDKKHFNKFVSFWYSTLAAVLTKPFYSGMQLIPTYPDARMIGTIKRSIKILDSNKAVLLFPEDSSHGYMEVLTEYFAGFVTLAKMYYKRTGIDVPIYPVYFHNKAKKLIIGKPEYVQPLLASGMSEKEISMMLKDRANELCATYVFGDKKEDNN